jgi:Rrf2 family protein
MIFSKPWTYAIRALLYLAEHRDQGPILSTTIAENEGIPAPYLVKILGTLNSAKIVGSTRGPGGGFSLQVDPKKLNLMRVVVLFDSVDLFQDCILGLGLCGENEQCPIHRRWKEPKAGLMSFLEETTLADLALEAPDARRKLLEEKLASRA